MNKEDLKNRTKQYALRIIKLVEELPKTTTGRAISNQLIRSGTSIGANYRSALRARSKVEFIAKIGTVIEEADESAFWLEIIIESRLLKEELVKSILQETNELTAIFVSTRKSSKLNIINPKS